VQVRISSNPTWGPSLDKQRQPAPTILKAIRFARFDYSASWPAKVRNVSRLGSHRPIWPPKSSIIQLQSWFVDSPSTKRADQSRSMADFSPCSTSRRDSDGRVPSFLVSLARSSVVT